MTVPTPNDQTVQVALIEQARALLDRLALLTDNPSVYQAVREADMNLHLAAWQLASTTEIMPELER